MFRPAACIVFWLAASPAFGNPGAAPAECGQGVTGADTDLGVLRESNSFIEGDRAGVKQSSIHAPIVLRPGARLGAADGVHSSISVGPGAWLGNGESINGKIQVCSEGRTGPLTTVNGAILLLPAAQVDGDIETQNGAIEAEAATIRGSLRGGGGDITLRGTQVTGDIRIGPARKRLFGGGNKALPRIVLGPGAVVEGDLVFEREVELFVHVDAKIGEVAGAVAKPFTDRLPARPD